MSMLTFYINRAGKNLPAGRKKILQRAKGELREAFGRGWAPSPGQNSISSAAWRLPNIKSWPAKGRRRCRRSTWRN